MAEHTYDVDKPSSTIGEKVVSIVERVRARKGDEPINPIRLNEDDDEVFEWEDDDGEYDRVIELIDSIDLTKDGIHKSFV